MEANQRLDREQRREERRRMNEFGQNILRAVLADVFRESKLRVDLDVSSPNAGADFAQGLVVVSEEATKRVNEIASGATGLGFLEANARLTEMLTQSRSQPTTLASLVSGVREILEQHRASVMSSIESNTETDNRSSMEQLAEPRNSLVIRLKPETFAAIRTAYQLLVVEMRNHGVASTRIPTAYECIEGDDMALTNQFAVFAAYQLAHGRIFSSSQSVYVGAVPARMNQHMMRVSLQKTVNRAIEYMKGGGSASSRAPGYASSLGWRPVVGNGLGLMYANMY